MKQREKGTWQLERKEKDPLISVENMRKEREKAAQSGARTGEGTICASASF